MIIEPRGGVVPHTEATPLWVESVALTVRDIGRPEAFIAVFMSTGRYHHRIALNTWQSAGAGRRELRRTGLHSVTLGCAGQRPAATLQDPWGAQLHIRSAAAGPWRATGSQS